MILAATLIGLAGCDASGGTSDVEGPVRVYVSLPLGGPRAVDGRDAADGARLALEQAEGRAGELEVESRFLGDAKGRRWDAAAVGANARSAAQDSSAVAYIGELESGPTRTSLPILNDAGIAQVSPGASAVDLTREVPEVEDSPDRYRPSGEPTFARVIPDDQIQALAAVEVVRSLGARDVATVSDNAPFARLMGRTFVDEARRSGLAVVDRKIYPGQRSIGNPADTLVGRADAVYFVAAPGKLDALIDAAQPLRHQQLIVPDPLAEPDLESAALAGRSIQVVAAALGPTQLADPGRRFAAGFRKRFSREPGPYAAYGYEAMQVVLQAIGEAETVTESFRSEVVEELLSATRTDTAIGDYSITNEGETTLCLVQPYRGAVAEKPICAEEEPG